MNQILNLIVNLQNNIGAPGRQVTNTLTNVGNAAAATERRASALGRALRLLGTIMKGVGSVLGSFLAQMVAFEAIKAGFASLVEGIRELDELAKSSARLGMTTEQLSGLRAAAKFSGVEVEMLNEALRQMATRVDEARKGNDDLAKQFKQIGVDLSGSRGLNEIINDVSDGLSRIQDPAKRLNLALELTGRTGQRAAQFLAQGSEAIGGLVAEAEKFGGIVSSDVAAKAEKVVDAMTRFQLALRGAFLTMGEDAFPKFASVLNRLAELIAQYQRPIIQAIQKVLDTVLRVLTGFASLVIGLFTEGKFNEFATALLSAVGSLFGVIFSTIRAEAQKFFVDILEGFKIFIRDVALVTVLTVETLIKQLSTMFIKSDMLRNLFDSILEGTSGEVVGRIQKVIDGADVGTQVLGANMKTVSSELQRISDILLNNPLFAQIFGEDSPAIRRLLEALSDQPLEKVSDDIKTFGDVAKGVTMGLEDAFGKLNKQFNTLSGLAQEVSGIVTGGFNAIRSSAVSAVESVLDGSATMSDAFREFGRSIIRTLINMAAQFLVLIPILLLFNVLSGGALAASGAGVVTAALGSITGVGLPGKGGAPAPAPAPSAQSIPVAPSSLQAGARAGGGGSMIVINTLDSADLESYLARPRNAEAVASALGTRSGSPTFRNAVAGAF
jgi:hypothetical protein